MRGRGLDRKSSSSSGRFYNRLWQGTISRNCADVVRIHHPSKAPSLVPPIRVNRSSIWQWSNCCNDRLAPCITASFHPRMRDRQWKAINNYPELPRPGKGNVQLTLAKVRQNLSSAPSLSANNVQDHEKGRSPWKNRGNRHPELVHTRFSQRCSGDDEESGHFNGKQIDTPPCLLSFTALSTLHKIVHPISRRLAKIHSESDLPKATAH